MVLLTLFNQRLPKGKKICTLEHSEIKLKIIYMKIRNVSPLILFGLVLITSCSQAPKKEKMIAQNSIPTEKIEEKLPTISEFTAVDKGFSVLTSIIAASDVKDILNSDGRFTIFAPINLAFEKLPKGSLAQLLLPENEEQRNTLLKYHIIPSAISKEDIAIAVREGRGSIPLQTLGGKLLTASLKGNDVFLIDENGNGATLVITDVEASNGFIHTLEVVMTPKK